MQAEFGLDIGIPQEFHGRRWEIPIVSAKDRFIERQCSRPRHNGSEISVQIADGAGMMSNQWRLFQT
jgi:hypothetical protein